MNIDLLNNIDALIFIGFLVINLVVGLAYSQGVKNIKEYAIGNKSFSTGAIAATIAATWIGGGVLSQTITETYKQGLYFIIPALGDSLVLFVIGYFLAPYLVKFLNNLSISDAIHSSYGKAASLVTTLVGIIVCIGVVAVQFRVSATVLQLVFNVSSFYAVLFSAIIVVVYSALGGIKAVTFTDVVQIFTFATIIPIISFIIWGTLGDPYKAYLTVTENPLFDYKEVLNVHNHRFLDSLSLFLFFIIPTLEPAIFQRVGMARNVLQIKKSFITASLICLAITMVIHWIGILLLADNPSLEPNNLLTHIINNYSYTGLKGLIAIGIMAVIMSTADSYINSASILFSHNFCKPLELRFAVNNELLLSRIASVFIGVGAFFLAFNAKSILDLTLLIWGSYMPIVTVPLMLAIFGFRSSSKSVLIGMSAGIITMIVFKLLDFKINSTIPAMAANLFFLIGSHYLLNQQGGWGNLDKDSAQLLNHPSKKKINAVINSIKNFNFWEFCYLNTPKQEITYIFFGIFCIISIFSTIYSMPIYIRNEYEGVIEFIYNTVLISASIFLTYSIWPPGFKNKKFISVIWNLSIFYVLAFIEGVLVLVSDFGQFQSMIFVLNLMVIGVLLRWQMALLIIISGIIASVKWFKWYLNMEHLPTQGLDLQIKIMYSMLLVSSILIAFLKPKQEYQTLTEEQNAHLSSRIGAQEIQTRKALELKGKFIRNIQHEYHAPMVGISSMAEALLAGYDYLSDKQITEGLDTIVKSSTQLKTFDDNIVSLLKLSKEDYTLNKEEIDFSNLSHERIEICRKLYEKNREDREFILDIQEGIIINADKYYLTQVLDNLVINAISYCKQGKIVITLKQAESSVEFTITDEGIGIPQKDLAIIFEEFVTSSRTDTFAGGRGVGLALAKRVIEVHGGAIFAESNGVKGARFIFVLPLTS